MLRLAPLSLLLLCFHASGAERWILLKSPHFEMYTTNGERQAAAALKQFEQVRYFFIQSSPSKSAPDAKVRIVAFRSEKEYKPYRVHGGSEAYYLRSRKVDYIVMEDISSEHYQTATHEYTHLIVEHLGLKLPVWLNEGLADVYSSLEAKANQAIVGRPLPGHMAVLMNQRWLDLSTLFAVTPDSPYYNEADKMSIFYAQSWALTHMLSLGKNYRAGFAKFLTLAASGRSTAECLQAAYGKTPADIAKDLQLYVHQSSVQGAIYDVRLKSADLDAQVSDPSEFNVQLALADLLAAQSKKAAEAQERLTRLAAEHPESADVEESLGYLAWQQGDSAKARDSFGRALAKGSKDPEMMLHYASLLQQAQAPWEQIMAVLEKASELKPENTDIWFDLGMTAMNAKSWRRAIQALSHIKRVTPQRAYPLFSALAYCDLQMKDLKLARENAARAQQYASTPDQTLQISRMLDYLDALARRGNETEAAATNTAAMREQVLPVGEKSAAAPPPLASREVPRDRPEVHWTDDVRHVEGLATSLACDGEVPRLHVVVAGKEMIFELADPHGIVVRNIKGGKFDFHCGAQKPMRLVVFYVPETARAGLNGVVRELVF